MSSDIPHTICKRMICGICCYGTWNMNWPTVFTHKKCKTGRICIMSSMKCIVIHSAPPPLFPDPSCWVAQESFCERERVLMCSLSLASRKALLEKVEKGIQDHQGGKGIKLNFWKWKNMTDRNHKLKLLPKNQITLNVHGVKVHHS